MDPLPCFHRVSPFHSIRKILFCSSRVIGTSVFSRVMYPQLSYPMGAAPAKENPSHYPQGHPATPSATQSSWWCFLVRLVGELGETHAHWFCCRFVWLKGLL